MKDFQEMIINSVTTNVDDKKKGDKHRLHKQNVFIRLLQSFRGFCTFCVYAVNTVIWCTTLIFAAMLKLLIPIPVWRHFITKVLVIIAFIWIRVNNFSMKYLARTRLTIEGIDNLEPKEWYLVLSNHQSWVDILVLQRIFYRQIPFLKFFLKKELIWVPFLGIAWWALDFPFMKRYSKAFLAKNPHLKGKDIEITRKACEKFKTIPVSVMNFVEGTRFTESKHKRQQSPFRHLLKPKAGGVAQVLSAMGEYINYLVNVTIVYNDDDISFWAFLCGKIDEIKITVETTPINREILGDYANDEAYRQNFQEWINQLWTEKDQTIEKMKP